MHVIYKHIKQILNIFSAELTRVEELFLSMALHFQKKKRIALYLKHTTHYIIWMNIKHNGIFENPVCNSKACSLLFVFNYLFLYTWGAHVLVWYREHMKMKTISCHDIAEKLLKLALYTNHLINHFEDKTPHNVTLHEKLL